MAANPNSRPDAPKPLGVRANAEQRRILQEAAKREHRSVSSFVLRAALNAAEPKTEMQPSPPIEKTEEEVKTILANLRAAFLAANPHNPYIVAEFLAERRAEAAREESR